MVDVLEFGGWYPFLPRGVCLGVPRDARGKDLYWGLILLGLVRFGHERVDRGLVAAGSPCVGVLPVCLVALVRVVVVVGGAHPIAWFCPEEQAPSFV